MFPPSRFSTGCRRFGLPRCCTKRRQSRVPEQSPGSGPAHDSGRRRRHALRPDAALCRTCQSRGRGDLRIVDGQPARVRPRLISDRAAWYVQDILRGSPMPDGWSRGQSVHRSRAVAFKTGTPTASAMHGPSATRIATRLRFGLAARTARRGRINSAAMSPRRWCSRYSTSCRPSQHKRIRRPRTPFSFQAPMACRGRCSISRPTRMSIRVVSSSVVRRLRLPIRQTGRCSPSERACKTERCFCARRRQRTAAGGMINGHLLPATSTYLAPTTWIAPGPGFARIVVIDAQGRSSSSEIQIKLDRG